MKQQGTWTGLMVVALLGATVMWMPPATGQEPAEEAAEPLGIPPMLDPDEIVWETNEEDPPIGSPDAIRGGEFVYPIYSYPLTFRLMGPNSNDAFAAWNRAFTWDFGLVIRHPMTDNFYPWMATDWSVQDDQRTLYFRLDPDARWSDGEPVTADDYVFTLEMMQSEFIVDPFWNSYAEQYLDSVDAVDDYTLRIVGTRPSWRPLADYALFPTPRHAIALDEEWVTRSNNVPQVTAGPYVVTETERGQSVTFERVDDWWGDDKLRFRGMYNPDRIRLPVIPLERSLDFLRQRDVDAIVENTARTWNEEYTFEAVRNGWLRRVRAFVEMPAGMYGLNLNLEAPIFRNKDFRKAMQYLFNFDRLNRNLMYNEYFRQVSFFHGSEYASPDLEPYGFDPGMAAEHLARAGYSRPADVTDRTIFGRVAAGLEGLLFTRSDTEDVLRDEQGNLASFSVIYGSRGLERHLTVMQQEYRRAGIDMRLQLLEAGTAFERGLERKYEATVTARGTAFYPEPRQYLHSEFKATTNNNNIWGFGTPETDELIRIYQEDLDLEDRLAAMHRLDEIVQDEAFYVPFWDAPYSRLAYWDYVQFPEYYLPRRTQPQSAITDWFVWWVDDEKRAALEEAMATGEPLPVDPELDKDFFNVMEGR